MNLSDLIQYEEKKELVEYFKCLILTSKSDGGIADSEMEILNNTGKKLGLTSEEISRLIERAEPSYYRPPYELEERFVQLYHILQVVLADGVVHEAEERYARYFAITSGFHSIEVDKLIEYIVKGIDNNIDAEDLFIEYKKCLKNR